MSVRDHLDARSELELLTAALDEIVELPAVDDARRRAFRDARPFPHLVIDDFLHNGYEQPVADIVGRQTAPFSKAFDDIAQKNKTISTGDDVDAYLQILAARLSSAAFLRYLEDLTGHRGLIPDPYYNTEVGYYHIMGPGGVLGSHVDHSHHKSLKIPHLLNLVVYISPEWRDEHGGDLLLYDASGRRIEATVPCRFNRAVIFASNPTAYHGVRPLADDAPTGRHSLYLAYYAVPVPESVEGPPSILRQLPDGKAEDVLHPTYFVVPTRELLRRRNWPHLRARLEGVATLLLPPIIRILARRIRRRRAA